jgi:hypothetical protein
MVGTVADPAAGHPHGRRSGTPTAGLTAVVSQRPPDGAPLPHHREYQGANDRDGGQYTTTVAKITSKVHRSAFRLR